MSFWGKLGKAALKVAPIAAGFIPGVGPLASMAIGGIAAGASKKLEGGSWKDSLLSGGIGAGTGYASGKLGELAKTKLGYGGKGKGIGPSDGSFLRKEVGGVSDKIGRIASGTKKMGTLGKIGLTALGAAPLIAGGIQAARNNTGIGPSESEDSSYNTWPGSQYGGVRNPDISSAISQGQMMGQSDLANRGIGPSLPSLPQMQNQRRRFSSVGY